MTAIAYRDGIMAADSARWGCTSSSVIIGHSQKIVRLPDGSLFAACGAASDCKWVAGLLARGPEGLEGRKLEDTGFNALWVRPDGMMVKIEHDLRPFDIPAPFYAIGYPETFMFGALHAGASAYDAVRLAIAHTDGAGGDVQVERLSPRPERPASLTAWNARDLRDALNDIFAEFVDQAPA